MKKIFNILIVLGLSCFVHQAAQAQAGPPDPPGQHGSTTNEPSGGGADLGMGAGLLLSLSAAYALKKTWKHYHRLEE